MVRDFHIRTESKTLCDFCTDLRTCEPARYVSTADGEDDDWLKKAKAEKKFLSPHYDEKGHLDGFYVIDHCPICGRELVDNGEEWD